MNFLSAIKHAAIDYGIRRKMWAKDAILSMGNGHDSCELYWCNTDRCEPVRLLGPDMSYDLSAEDIQATDWETI